MKTIRLEAVAVKEELDDEYGMASNIIIEVVDPLSNPNLPINLGLNRVVKTEPPWVALFNLKFDNYNGIVETINEVQEVVNRLEEATSTRFSVIKTRRKSFGCTEFNPNAIKVYWGGDGIPYTILNKKLLDCQHGRYRRPLPKGEQKIGQPVIMPSGVLKYKVTKKVGCPAQIRIREILRFPEYRVLENTSWRQKIQSKALKKAFHSGDLVTHHRCFVVSLPKIEHHENHVIEPVDVKPVSPKVKKKKLARIPEPVHPRILQKIRDLACDGVTSTKNIRDHLMEFVTDELSQEEEITSLESRRFSPRDQDIRSVIKKVQNDLRKNGSSLAEVQCTAIIKDLGSLVSSNKSEMFLEQLKSHLEHLRSIVKEEASLEPLLSCSEKVDEIKEPSPKKIKVNHEEQEVANYTTFSAKKLRMNPEDPEVGNYTFNTIADGDHESQMLYDDDPLQVKGEVTHVYFYE